MDILDIIRDINKELREIIDIKHKYKRRYKKGNKWIYVYDDENGKEYTKGEKESGDKVSSVEDKVNKGIISKIFEKFNIKMSENSAGYNNIANCVFALSKLFMKKSSSGNKGSSSGNKGSSSGNGKVSSGDKEKKPSEADKIMAKFGFGNSSNDIKKQLLLLAKEYAKIEMSGEVSDSDGAVSDGDNSGDKDSKIDNNSSKEKEEQSDKDKPVRNYDRVLGDKNKKELDMLAEKMVKNGEGDFPEDIFKSIVKKYKDRLNEDAKKTFDDKEAENVVFMYFASVYEKHQNQLYEKNKEKERELLRKEKENKKKEVASVSLNIGKVEDLLKKRDASSFYEYAINSEKGSYTLEDLRNDFRELRISVNEFLKNKSDSEVEKFIDNNILTDEVVDTLYYRKKELQAVAGMVNFLKTIKGSDYLVKKLIDKVAIRSDNDSEEVNSIMKSFGFSVRVDDNCVMTKNSRMINDVKKDVNRIDVKGVNVFANKKIINNLNTTESELKSNIEAVYNSLPEYSKNLLKETDSNVYFVSKKDATI
ncbi:MAG: hypothetical protein EOL97_15670, partial [Spirochaetia bacterium]|nr:hypothetical protein [Spirochaetia bacterium]